MKQLPLRIKITMLVGLVLTLACVILTVNSIYSAQGYYSVLEERSAQDNILPDGEVAFLDPVSPYAIATRQFSIQSVIVMVVVVLLFTALTYWLTGRVLRPLTNLTNAIRATDQGSLHQRVDIPGVSGEVRELTESFNNMLGRLEDSFKIQKNFAANAAHELKTPIAVLKTSLQVLEMDKEPTEEDYREFTDAAKSGIDRLIGTVDALMTLAQTDNAGNMELVAIRPLLSLIFSELKPRADALDVQMSLSGDCRLIRGNQTLLYRMLFNLVENSVKYNRIGGRVEAVISDTDGHIQIQIADTGIGMSKENACHAFEPFYRADQSRSQKIPGSGLGLSVVKTIAERHHGRVKLDSAEGSGTTVTVIL